MRVNDLIAPLFVREGIDEPQPIRSLPGVVQHTRDSLRAEVVGLAELGVKAVVLFGVPSTKDAVGRVPTTRTASCRWRCVTSSRRSVTTSC